MNYESAPEVIKGFIMDKKVIKNRSDLTVNEYCLDLTNFLIFTYSRKKKIDEEKVDANTITMDFVHGITSADIYEYMLYVASVKQNKAAARARKLVAIREYFKYLFINNKIKENPAANISTPSIKKALPKFLTLNESIALLECVKSDNMNKNKVRDFAIITIFLNCGLRLSELVGLNLSSINYETKSMIVLGKGNKERTVYLNDSCIDAINDYLKIRMSLESKDKNALFISRDNQRISNKTVQWMVKKYLKMAGFEGRKLSTHKLRHTAATLMYSTGKVDVRVLKDILGHEQLNTTQIYTHISDDMMKKAIETNPLSNIKIKESKE